MTVTRQRMHPLVRDDEDEEIWRTYIVQPREWAASVNYYNNAE